MFQIWTKRSLECPKCSDQQEVGYSEVWFFSELILQDDTLLLPPYNNNNNKLLVVALKPRFCFYCEKFPDASLKIFSFWLIRWPVGTLLSSAATANPPVQSPSFLSSNQASRLCRIFSGPFWFVWSCRCESVWLASLCLVCLSLIRPSALALLSICRWAVPTAPHNKCCCFHRVPCVF